MASLLANFHLRGVCASKSNQALSIRDRRLGNPRRWSCRNLVILRDFDTTSSSSIPDHKQLRRF
jgi:hypothetical protein